MKHVRHGIGTARPYVHGHLDLWDLVREVFDSEEVERFEFEIGDPPHSSGSPGSIYVYIPDVDEAYRRALNLGATPIDAPEDKPYQERVAGFRDSYGNTWYISTYRGTDGGRN